MAAALDRFILEGIDARRPAGSQHQIKVTPDLSFYPDKGTILPDRGCKLEIRGIDELIDYLRENGQLSASRHR
jgi:hypothetical protein